MIDLLETLRRIQSMNTGETFNRLTDSLEALSMAIGGAGPGTGLWMFGHCVAGMAASLNTITTDNLGVQLYDDMFNDYFWMQVVHNDNAPGVAPEGERQRIRDFAAATQIFTVDPFSANVEQEDIVVIYHDSILQIQLIFDIVNAILVTTETGGTIATTGPGTEDNIYINNAPAGVYEPLKVQIDFTNQTVAETVVVRTYYRISAGGNLILKDEVTFAGSQAPRQLRNVELEPNRFGIRVTMERTAGAARNYDWTVFYRG